LMTVVEIHPIPQLAPEAENQYSIADHQVFM